MPSLSSGLTGGSQGNHSSSKSSPLSGGPLSEMLQRGDPVLAFEWIGVIIDPANPNPIPSVYIESIQAPGISIQADNRFFNGRNLAYPGTVLSDNLSIQLYNDNTGAAAALVTSWFEDTLLTDTGGYKRPSQFKKTVLLQVHDIKGKPIYTVEFGGCWPVSGMSDQWAYSASDPRPIQLSLSVDYIYAYSSTQ